jgi:hypothetical protein
MLHSADHGCGWRGELPERVVRNIVTRRGPHNAPLPCPDSTRLLARAALRWSLAPA